MQESYKLIRKTKRKFITFSVVGIALVCIISSFALSFHHKIVAKHALMQELYTRLGNQFQLINKISSLSEKFDSPDRVKTNEESLKVEFNSLIADLNDENKSLEMWLVSNSFSQVSNVGQILRKENSAAKISAYIQRAKELANEPVQTIQETRNHIKFLSKSSRDGIGEVLNFVSQKLSQEQTKSLSQLNRTGMLLVGLCILQVILVWLLVFRPLYSTVLLQHQKISSALLSAKSASRSKTDFLANISHEIRTPMTAILGYADLLKRNGISIEEKNDAVKIIDQNANHLLGLIDEILDISKIEAGKFDFEKENVNLSQLLNEVYSLIHVKSEDKGIDLVFRNQGQIPEHIEADPKRLKQILFNILGNAIKFTKKGYVDLTVYFDKAKEKLVFKVKDTGCGIPKDQHKKLFRPFQQADTSVSREYGGTGLGLVLSKGLAQGMGGDIKILQSKPGIGTTFQIDLDVGHEDELNLLSSFSTNIAENNGPAEIDETKLKGLKVLVVDDAKENARLFQMYLKEAGASVEMKNDGESAIELAKATFFDIILLDLQMPGLDGYQVISELRENGFSRPIVALTAHAMKEEKMKTKEAGFNGHITKPVKADELIESVSSYSQGIS